VESTLPKEQLPVDLALFQRERAKDPHSRRVNVFAVLDLDRFKALNDRLGHAAGDQVLREFAALATALVRPGDYIARWGGEEFVIVLRDMVPESAEEALRRILDAVAAHPFRLLDQMPVHITCSIGYATIRAHRVRNPPCSEPSSSAACCYARPARVKRTHPPPQRSLRYRRNRLA
jgi:diguanylate cyclase (GGDEF)-like protein